jgi:hypothetical protein
MLKHGLLTCLLFVAIAAAGQEFGGNPASIRWKQIDTDTVRVIFPEGFDAKAQRVAAITHELQRNYGSTIGDKFRKVNIVLHNETLVSNAYVQLAPWRSEFYMNPPQSPFGLGGVNWTDNLSIHEFRHVQQYSNFNKGSAKFAYVLLGEQGQALLNALSIPDWFFEGDAVFNETKLSRQGRGTMPLFMSGYRSLYEANKQYNYQQLRNGSLRKYIPDHYSLGYLLIAYGRQTYGDDIWRKVTDEAARFKTLVYPFQSAVKKYTGIPFNRFVDSALQYYRSQWKPDPVSPKWLTSLVKNDVVNYKYPYRLEDGSMLVLKTSLRSIPAFYKVYPDSREKKIAVKDISLDDHYSYNNGKIVYAAYQPDARWGFREFTTIQLLDINTGQQTTVASRSKYLSPDISHDGKQLIAVRLDEQVHTKLILMNTSGELVDSIQATDPKIFFSQPKFAADDQHYYVVARNDAGEMALMKYGKTAETLLPFSNRLLGEITVQGDTLLYTQSWQGRDEIWALIDGKENSGPFRMASFTTGLYQAALQSDGKLVSSAFTADGYRLANFQPSWQKNTTKSELTDLYVGEKVFRQSDHTVLNALPAGNYPVSKYRKSFRLLNFHSWRPFYADPEFSFSIYGENVLNTLQSELNYTYNQNEGSNSIGYTGVYGGTWLQPVFGINQTWNRSAVLNKDTTLQWNEFAAFAGLQLPLNLSRGKAYRFMTISSIFNTNQVDWTGIAEKLVQNRTVNYLSTRISYSGQIQKAAQQIYPHWAQTLLLQYKTAVDQHVAHQFLASGSLYMPGLANSHSFVVDAAYQVRDTMNQYLYSNNFPFARGYAAVDFPQMWKLGVNYHFPLLYPDWGFANLVYFRRIRSNLFYDYSEGKSLRTGIKYPFQTVGAELWFDTKWWNQLPLSFGIRYNRLLNNEFRGPTQPNVWEFMLPVNLID